MTPDSLHKMNFFLVFTVLACMCFAGCSEDTSPAGPGEKHEITVTYGSSAGTVNLDELTRFRIDGMDAVKLSDIVDTERVIDPDNHAYRIIGADGFSAHEKGNPDNIWEHLLSGYIFLSDMRVVFDSSLGLPSRYNIKSAAEMKILRKIDFVSPADSLIQFIVSEMPQTVFEDTLSAVVLTEFVPSEVVTSLSFYSYTLFAADGYSIILSDDQLITGYYIPDFDRVLYSDPDISGRYKITRLNRITAMLLEI